MRETTDVKRIEALFQMLGRRCRQPIQVYLTGGATAVLHGWRERSIFIAQHGEIRFYHYDPYSQVLSKIERGHAQDMKDVKSAIRSGAVKPARLLELFEAVEKQLYRYPAIDPHGFRKAVLAVLKKSPQR